MKIIKLTKKQAKLLRKHTEQEYLPKRLVICDTEGEYIAGVLGEFPILSYPYRNGDDVFYRYTDTISRDKFLKDIGVELVN